MSGTHFSLKRIGLRSVMFAAVLGLLVITTTARAQTEIALYSFTGYPDGNNPSGRLIQDATGNLYGTTVRGGPSSWGTVFEVTPTGTETLLHSFTGSPDGLEPTGGLVRDAAGNLYGTTGGGGTYDYGTVFKVTPTGRRKVLYSFTDGADGGQPTGVALIWDAQGNLYGTAFTGGAFGAGTVFEIAKPGTLTVLYSFTGGADGWNPAGGLVRDAAGNLYGTTYRGGAFDYGTVFKVTPTGTETVLHSFTGRPDGFRPIGPPLVLDAAGNLYGTSFQGGTSDLGIVFEVTPTGTETVLHSFTGSPDGATPGGDLIWDATGNLYGTTYSGGASDLGTVFKITTTGTLTVLYSFTGSPDGANPSAGLIWDAAGNLYGTTYYGGVDIYHGYGTVFKLIP